MGAFTSLFAESSGPKCPVCSQTDGLQVVYEAVGFSNLVQQDGKIAVEWHTEFNLIRAESLECAACLKFRVPLNCDIGAVEKVINDQGLLA